MEYIPTEFRRQELVEGMLSDLTRGVSRLTIVRKARVLKRWAKRNGTIDLQFEGLAGRVRVPASLSMRFGTETVTAEEYLERVIEENDLLNLIWDSAGIRVFWIDIRYADRAPNTLRFSAKDDGLFAMRTKAGEKSQRRVAKDFCSKFKHTLPASQTDSPGFFEIRYADKKTRKADLVCQRCGLKVEVKKRNRDRKYRISHSSGRPFSDENDRKDWHAFVFPDRTIHWVPNTAIAAAVESGQIMLDGDEYDAWADVKEGEKLEAQPPSCPEGQSGKAK